MQRQPLSHPSSAAHMSPDGMNTNRYPLNYNDANINFDHQNIDNCDESQLKAFYNKADTMPTGPYATTVILTQLPDRVSYVCLCIQLQKICTF